MLGVLNIQYFTSPLGGRELCCPIYEFQCEIGHLSEFLAKNYEEIKDIMVKEKCKHCGKPLIRKMPSVPALKFNGTGFYGTDYKEPKNEDK